jgi:enterochelin esterase-like enzyme
VPLLRRAGHLVPLAPFRPRGGVSRPVRAWIPAGDATTHPLLVMFDGGNVFADEGSYAGGWHAHDAVDRLSARTFERPVILAIGNGGVHRIRELGTSAPWFLDALIADVLPRARAHLPIDDRCVLGGASLGGLAAIEGWMLHPTVFHGALAMSPSLWFAHHALLRRLLHGAAQLPASGKLYLDAGRRERGTMFTDAEHLAASLTASGWGDERLLWRPDASGTHRERHWRRRLPKALRFLFRRPGR